jgi:hypothetical protein
MKSAVPALLLLAQVSAHASGSRESETASGWQAGDIARRLPFSARCGLVREIFSPAAFDELVGYLDAACADRARIGGRARVVATIDAGPVDEITGVAPTDYVFAAKERCEGQRFVVLGPREMSGLKEGTAVIGLSFYRPIGGSYGFRLSVEVFPNGTAGCIGVAGQAARKGRKWTIGLSRATGAASRSP